MVISTPGSVTVLSVHILHASNVVSTSSKYCVFVQPLSTPVRTLTFRLGNLWIKSSCNLMDCLELRDKTHILKFGSSRMHVSISCNSPASRLALSLILRMALLVSVLTARLPMFVWGGGVSSPRATTTCLLSVLVVYRLCSCLCF